MNELVVFDEVAATIAEYKVENDKLVFDYADKQGAKDAKSHIMKLRKVKTKVGEIHKEAKAESRAFGLKLDAKKNEYNGEVDKMIKVHKEPLDVIEAEVIAESLRKQQEYADVQAKKITEIEARERAVILKEEKVIREKTEAEETIRREKAAEAERVIKEQQAETAKMQAELDKEKAMREARDKADAEAEEERLAEMAAEKAIETNRITDKKHRKKVEDEVHSGLTKTGHLGNVQASEVLEAIKENKIPHVSINY